MMMYMQVKVPYKAQYNVHFEGVNDQLLDLPVSLFIATNMPLVWISTQLLHIYNAKQNLLLLKMIIKSAVLRIRHIPDCHKVMVPVKYHERILGLAIIKFSFYSM